MPSLQQSHDDSKWKAALTYLVERVLLFIERVWRERRSSMDLPLQQRIRYWHHTIGHLHEALQIRQSGRAHDGH